VAILDNHLAARLQVGCSLTLPKDVFQFSSVLADAIFASRAGFLDIPRGSIKTLLDGCTGSGQTCLETSEAHKLRAGPSILRIGSCDANVQVLLPAQTLFNLLPLVGNGFVFFIL